MESEIRRVFVAMHTYSGKILGRHIRPQVERTGGMFELAQRRTSYLLISAISSSIWPCTGAIPSSPRSAVDTAYEYLELTDGRRRLSAWVKETEEECAFIASTSWTFSLGLSFVGFNKISSAQNL